ncbi:maleylpyruvate isomerase family mycothiol-dependent enzyme [Streptomyces sp. NBC_01455]|uniref:maleylpyruvate isomerase family mycothiol-dependent enzyme n=1 Tax=Streptomyces sp. NBC_01455 TaxID=2903874 RepID=UPI002E32A955|nr:maleylpyruvate isomerase family mycothiol-dependent enzyme [Streptomyces sp. NBC_01455]
MDVQEFVKALDAEGRSLAAAAERAGPDAEVATCPGWQVRDLVRHTGMVHRWARAFVTEGHTAYLRDGGLPELDGAELLAWFRDGHRRLVDSLASAPLDVECWSFLPAPSPLAFWARRQAHETTVHRVDAQSALDGTPDAVALDFAVDGIDELLRGFHGRTRSKVRAQAPCVLRVRATDADAVWTLRLSPEPPVSERGPARGARQDEDPDVDCEVSGPAARLYLALWNRLPFPTVTGDSSLVALWRETSAVTWS